MCWLLVTTLVTIGFVLWYLLVKPLNYWKERGVSQGRPMPIFGDNWKVIFKIQNIIDFVQDIYKIAPEKRYCGIYQISYPTLVIKDPALIRQITVKDFDHFTDHNNIAINTEADPLFGKNLIFLEGQHWKHMRSFLSPSFTGSKMRYMFTLIHEAAETFVEYFKKRSEEIIEVDLKDIFTRYTNDVIATSAFGIKIDSLGNPENEFYRMGKEATSFGGVKKTLKVVGYTFIPKILKAFKVTFLGDEVNNFFLNIIEETVKEREDKNIVRPDMINLLLEAKKHNSSSIPNSTEEQQEDIINSPQEITNTDIAAQALIFFLAGFDTTATFLSFTAYELAVNPDIQKKLRNEIIETMEENDGKITYEAVMKMKYLDMVVSESLRKWPVAAVSDRKCTKPYTIEPTRSDEKPLHMKRGDLIWIPVFGLHRDPKYYPNPEKFDPERFSDDNKDNIEPYTYLPFGAGPRNCIGSRFALLEGKTLLCAILGEFEIVPTEKTKIPLVIDTRFDLSPIGGFNLGLKRLKQ